MGFAWVSLLASDATDAQASTSGLGPVSGNTWVPTGCGIVLV
jgi:hypothetical protein